MNEMQDIFSSVPDVLEWLERAKVGDKLFPLPIDGMPIEILRLMDTNYTPDGVTLTLTTEQLTTVIHALGIAGDQFVKLAASCHAMGNTRHTQDTALRDAGNTYTQRACDLVDLMLVLREGAKSNG